MGQMAEILTCPPGPESKCLQYSRVHPIEKYYENAFPTASPMHMVEALMHAAWSKEDRKANAPHAVFVANHLTTEQQLPVGFERLRWTPSVSPTGTDVARDLAQWKDRDRVLVCATSNKGADYIEDLVRVLRQVQGRRILTFDLRRVCRVQEHSQETQLGLAILETYPRRGEEPCEEGGCTQVVDHRRGWGWSEPLDSGKPFVENHFLVPMPFLGRRTHRTAQELYTSQVTDLAAGRSDNSLCTATPYRHEDTRLDARPAHCLMPPQEARPCSNIISHIGRLVLADAGRNEVSSCSPTCKWVVPTRVPTKKRQALS